MGVEDNAGEGEGGGGALAGGDRSHRADPGAEAAAPGDSGDEGEAEARIRAALGGYLGDDWIDQAVLTIESHIALKTKRKEWDCSTVGKRIRTARELAGMSQRQMALRLNVSQFAVSQWERGLGDLPSSKVRGIATSCAVAVPWLLMESEEGGPKVRNGILRANRPIKLVKYMREKAKLKAAKQEAARLNALRQAVSTLTSEAPLREDSRRKKK